MTSKLLNWRRATGLDTLQDEYTYSRGDTTGYTSSQKIPDQWVATTLRLLLSRMWYRREAAPSRPARWLRIQ